MNLIITSLLSLIVGGLITYYFTKKTENYKFELLKREQAAKVAELFALWMKCDDKVLENYSPQERRDHCEKLNKLTWELTIWIQDEEMVKSIMNKLAHKSRKDIKEIILNIRKQIQDKKSKKLKWEDIVSFK